MDHFSDVSSGKYSTASVALTFCFIFQWGPELEIPLGDGDARTAALGLDRGCRFLGVWASFY